jgi:transcriptional regulator with XRE-family HTH domain
MSAEDENRKKAFGRRVQNHLNERGWTQAELARRMAPLVKPTFRMGRDNVSKWVRGKVLPLPPALEAMCKVLVVDVKDLLPARAAPIPEPDDHSACKETERRLRADLELARKERDEERSDAAKSREEARKDMAFYREEIAMLRSFKRI